MNVARLHLPQGNPPTLLCSLLRTQRGSIGVHYQFPIISMQAMCCPHENDLEKSFILALQELLSIVINIINFLALAFDGVIANERRHQLLQCFSMLANQPLIALFVSNVLFVTCVWCQACGILYLLYLQC